MNRGGCCCCLPPVVAALLDELKGVRRDGRGFFRKAGIEVLGVRCLGVPP